MTGGARVLDAAATAARLEYGRLVDAIECAALEREAGAIVCPDRQVVALADATTMLSMPAVAADVAIHKLITVAPRNAARGLPTLQGAMTVFKPATGRPMLVLDGPTVTAMRTAAVSMCAWRHLAPVDAQAVLVIGTGLQASHHVRAIAALHPDVRVRVRGRTDAQSVAFCEAYRGLLCDLAPDGGERPDVVIACTTSTLPVWHEPARPATLVIAIGSFHPSDVEIAGPTVRDSALSVDDLPAAPHEAGDLILAHVDWGKVRSLAQIVCGERSEPDRPQFFKSIGCAAWDLAAARLALATDGVAMP